MVRILLTTIDDTDKAHSIATCLVSENLAACVNIIPKVTAVYKWNGVVENTVENLLIIKTTSDREEALIERIQSLHTYDIPELISCAVDGGLERYLDWVIQETRPGKEPSGEEL